MATNITSAQYTTYSANQQKIIDRLSQQLGRAVTLEDVAEVLDFEDRVTDSETDIENNTSKDNVTEESDKSWGSDLARALDRKLDKAEFSTLLATAMANHHKDTIALMASLSSKIEAVAALVDAINALTNKVDGLKAALLTGFAKADADATITDTNYRATVAALLA